MNKILTPKEQYKNYLSSKKWKDKVKACKDRAGNKCQFCSSTKDLVVHHNTYNNVFNEEPTDLVCVCKRCHSILHKFNHSVSRFEEIDESYITEQPKFVKFFIDNNDNKLLNLSGQELHLLLMLVKECKYGNTINLTPKKKKIIAKEFGYKSHLPVTNLLHKLVNKDVIKKVDKDDKFDYNFIINPNLMFKGNDYQRAKIIIEYSSGERNVKVMSD